MIVSTNPTRWLSDSQQIASSVGFDLIPVYVHLPVIKQMVTWHVLLNRCQIQMIHVFSERWPHMWCIYSMHLLGLFIEHAWPRLCSFKTYKTYPTEVVTHCWWHVWTRRLQIPCYFKIHIILHYCISRYFVSYSYFKISKIWKPPGAAVYEESIPTWTLSLKITTTLWPHIQFKLT